MRYVWSGNGSGKQAQEPPGESPAKPGNNPATAKEHWCSEHNQEFKPKKGKYGTFYSHKAPDGSWCNEKA
jgi:hypothetical protein